MFGTVTAWSACAEHIPLKLREEFNKFLMTFVENSQLFSARGCDGVLNVST